MRYMLTLSAVHNDDLDAADVEVAAVDVWTELYPAEDADPVECAVDAAAVTDRDALAAFLDAAEVGLDGLDPEDAEVVAGMLSTFRDSLDRLSGRWPDGRPAAK